jgi:hypothetical protein
MRSPEVSEIHLNYKIGISNPSFTAQVKITQQGKHMRVGARKVLAYNSVKMANSNNKYAIDSDTFLVKGVDPSIHVKYSTVPPLTLF